MLLAEWPHSLTLPKVSCYWHEYLLQVPLFPRTTWVNPPLFPIFVQLYMGAVFDSIRGLWTCCVPQPWLSCDVQTPSRARKTKPGSRLPVALLCPRPAQAPWCLDRFKALMMSAQRGSSVLTCFNSWCSIYMFGIVWNVFLGTYYYRFLWVFDDWFAFHPDSSMLFGHFSLIANITCARWGLIREAFVSLACWFKWNVFCQTFQNYENRRKTERLASLFKWISAVWV